MKGWGSNTEIYDCLGSFPPLQTTAGMFLTIVRLLKCVNLCALRVNTLLTFHFAHQRVSANGTDLERLGVKVQSVLSIISKYRKNGGLCALDYWVEKFCLYVGSSVHVCLTLLKSSSEPSNFKWMRSKSWMVAQWGLALSKVWRMPICGFCLETGWHAFRLAPQWLMLDIVLEECQYKRTLRDGRMRAIYLMILININYNKPFRWQSSACPWVPSPKFRNTHSESRSVSKVREECPNASRQV